jgi:hypothetical protein
MSLWVDVMEQFDFLGCNTSALPRLLYCISFARQALAEAENSCEAILPES